jgi:hypothetical protein
MKNLKEAYELAQSETIINEEQKTKAKEDLLLEGVCT